MSIQKISVDAVSIKTTKKDGTPYMWNDKKANKMSPRTMVSIKSGDDWYMGWSYKTGSAAENIKKGDVIEVLITEDIKDNPDGTKSVFKNWKFPKQEDRDAQEIADLKARLAAAEAPVTANVVKENITPNPSADEPPF